MAPACAGAATALGRPLRRGAGAPAASDLKALGKVLAARLCGKDVDAKGAALLGLLGLNPAGPRGGASAPPPAGVAGASDARARRPERRRHAPPRRPSGGTTTPPAGGGAPQCANGKDDDGDGQIDALGKRRRAVRPRLRRAPATPARTPRRPLPAACTAWASSPQGSARRLRRPRTTRCTIAACPKP